MGESPSIKSFRNLPKLTPELEQAIEEAWGVLTVVYKQLGTSIATNSGVPPSQVNT